METPQTKPGDKIMTKNIWKQIYGVTLWNTFIFLILLSFGRFMYDLEFGRIDLFYIIEEDGKAVPTDKCTLYTIIFETFVFLQIFNQLNCRCINPNQYNMFANFLGNPIFLIIEGFTFITTILIV
eukprot:CAMPEP_0170568180 /NCGR_PEP_ID=MMETSP0211-20121228/80996_1 /TAXON_ID=311385 /ORGANISM="Pseudokeronopsis sp., Strain OXSARD2" /LENGTH=124 /DNA_ID=CAMNT_0010889925 /DNA_START=929 /DNA_END=1303 /DNA_ORIENTATION=-